MPLRWLRCEAPRRRASKPPWRLSGRASVPVVGSYGERSAVVAVRFRLPAVDPPRRLPSPEQFSKLSSYNVSLSEICTGQRPVTVGGLWLSQVMEQPTGTPTTPAGVLAAAGAQVAGLGETLWAARTSEELVEHRRAAARCCAPSSPPSRARCSPRCTPGRCRSPSWRGGRPRSGSPTWPAPTAATGTGPSGRPQVLVSERTAHPSGDAGRPGLTGAGGGDRGRGRQAPAGLRHPGAG